jgi:hypothetical protein
MSDEPADLPPDDRPLQQIQHSTATARVPDPVGRGVFATAAVVLHGANEFTIDFIQSIVHPSRVAARVILPPAVAAQFTAALGEAIAKYTQAFGSPPREPSRPPAPKPEQPAAAAAGGEPTGPSAPGGAGGGAAAGGQGGGGQPQQPTPIAEIYERLKLPDEMLGGVYANMASITHTGSEFCFDFVAQFFPRSAVTARIYMAAPRVPDLHASLKRSVGGG